MSTSPTPDNSKLHSALALEELIRANAESNDTMKNLVDHIQAETDARDRKIDELARNTRSMHRMAIALACAMAILIGIAIINATNLAAGRKNAARTAAIAQDTRQTNETLLDCLNSRGKCGSYNAAQAALTLDEVKKYELTVIYCARTNPLTEDPKGVKFIACVERLYPGGPELNGR